LQLVWGAQLQQLQQLQQLLAKDLSCFTKTGFFCKFFQNQLNGSVVTSNKPRKHLKAAFESMKL